LSRNNRKKEERNSFWFYFNVVLRVFHSLFLFIVVLLILGGSLALGLGLGYSASLVEDTDAPTKEELQQDLGDITETSKLVYNDNKRIATIQSDLLRTSVASDKISDLVKKAVIATEDENFYKHNGIVPKAVLRALISEVTGIGSSGGSTLTQQLVKQQILTNETTFKRKANEIMLAMEVERNFTKDEIITLYLNVSPFGRNNRGENIAGVQQAAQGIFGVNADEVSLPQAAFIAGLPQSPIVYNPYTNTGDFQEDIEDGLKRKDYVLFSMYRNHDISKKEYEEAKAYDLTEDFKPKEEKAKDDHGFLYYTVMEEATEIVAKKMADADEVSAEDYAEKEIQEKYQQQALQKLANGGYTIKSTIDKDIYQAMQQAVKDYGYMLDNYGNAPIEVGNVLMDNKTGKVLGFVGGRDYAKNQYNHAFSSTRQAGSAIKPILVYAPAIDQGLMGSESRVSDYATSWKQGENAGDSIVNATNKGTNTFMTVRQSLEHSSNIASYHIYQKTLNDMGSPTFVYDNYLKKMNYPNTPIWQYESASSGVPEVSTLVETNGFQTLANGGTYQKGYIVESITDSSGKEYYKHEENPVQVYSKQTASIMNDLMRSVLTAGYTTSYLSVLNSLDWNLGNADWVGKTGTTDDYVDSWLIVSNPNVTLSSWSGREDNKSTDSGAGQRSANYLAYMTNAIYQANPEIIDTNAQFKIDDGVDSYDVAKLTGTRPGGTMTVNNTSFTIPSETTKSYWAKSGPSTTEFKFGIGGTDANYANYWKKAMPKKKTTKSTKKDDTKEKKKETDKEDKEEADKTDDN